MQRGRERLLADAKAAEETGAFFILLECVLRHAKTYADLRSTITDAVTRYRDEICEGTFPGSEQTFE